MRKIILNIVAVLSLAGCGAAQQQAQSTATVFTFKKAQKDCLGCHAQAAFMANEAAFKSSQAVYTQVTASLMPKGNPYSTSEIATFKKYMGAK